MLYPIKFNPIFKDKIWGGQKISTILNKDFAPLPNCGESWELSGVKGDLSIVSNGNLKGQSLEEIITKYTDKLLGNKVYKKYGNEFPLLVKFIDANDALSIQVHPDDELARKRHNSFGKTEMWYVIQADDDATLISGFNQPIDRKTYIKYFKEGKITEVLNTELVSEGDVFFIPAGRIHTIGKGSLIAEIQQTSDVTYRIYDFDRVDDEGNKRDLHFEEALDAIDYSSYSEYKSAYSDQANTRVNIVESDYFKTNKYNLTKSYKRNLKDLDSFVIYICLEGMGELYCDKDGISLNKGDVILVPSEIKEVLLKTDNTLNLLETYIP